MLVDGSELARTTNATNCRVRADETLVTDGPYAEVKEALGELSTSSSARRSTRRSTGLRDCGTEHGAVEVRPVYVDPQEVQL